MAEATAPEVAAAVGGPAAVSVGDSNGSNPWAAQFGWPVGPGTLVTVSVSNLDRLFQTIGEQLTEQRSMINALTQRVGDQDTLIQQLREQGDTFVSYRDAADARLDEGRYTKIFTKIVSPSTHYHTGVLETLAK